MFSVRCCSSLGWCLTLAAALAVAGSAQAQSPVQNLSDRYQPLNQRTPPGVAAQWLAFQGKATPPYFQPVRVELPTTGQVTVFGPSPQHSPQLTAPALAAMMVGHLYRLKISRMPEFPGVELYPTVEVLDRLHPPPGRANDFPIPVQFTADEIEMALDGRLVTKVIYLEQPNLAEPRDLERPMRVTMVPNQHNLLAEADLVGRPMLIVRLGSRIPSQFGPDPTFYGTSPPAGAAMMMRRP